MPTQPRPFPAAMLHDELRELLPGMYLVAGIVGMPGPLPVRFSRNMTVVREGDRLALVNTVRLDEAGLTALDAFVKVTDGVRLAANRGVGPWCG